MHQETIKRFNSLKEKGLSIDITRGKPDKDQLDLSNGLIDISIPTVSDDGADLRNYGEPFGIIEARKLGSELLNAPVENVLACEQSSLLLTYQTVLANFLFAEPNPWKNINNPKFICPVPGFDRHFMMLGDFGIDAIPVPLTDEGIDLEAFTDVLKEENVVRDVMSNCSPPQTKAIFNSLCSLSRVYYQINLSRNHIVNHMWSAFQDFLYFFDFQSCFFQGFGCSSGGYQ